MVDPTAPPPGSRLRKLASIDGLTVAELQAFGNLAGATKIVGKYQDILREGDHPTECCLILEGFVCRYQILSEGKRQIMSFHIPGDIPDLQSLFISRMDHSVGTLTPCRVSLIPHQAILDLIDVHPRIARTLWRETLLDAAVSRQWLVGLGRRSAYGRVAHLLCEMVLRLKAVGLTDGYVCDLPMTQAELGDALGLSVVHANRTLQELRRNGLITLQAGLLRVTDWEGLKKAGEFDPTYLQLRLEQHDEA